MTDPAKPFTFTTPPEVTAEMFVAEFKRRMREAGLPLPGWRKRYAGTRKVFVEAVLGLGGEVYPMEETK